MCSAPFSVNHDLFHWFKDRANTSALKGWCDVDENIRDLVGLINEFPSIAPVYSCEGHGVSIGDDGQEYDDQHRFYLLMVVWDDGSYLIDELLRRTNGVTLQERPMDVTICQMENFSDITSAGQVYNGICLERYAFDPKDKLDFLERLTNTVKEMVGANN